MGQREYSIAYMYIMCVGMRIGLHAAKPAYCHHGKLLYEKKSSHHELILEKYASHELIHEKETSQKLI